MCQDTMICERNRIELLLQRTDSVAGYQRATHSIMARCSNTCKFRRCFQVRCRTKECECRRPGVHKSMQIQPCWRHEILFQQQKFDANHWSKPVGRASYDEIWLQKNSIGVLLNMIGLTLGWQDAFNHPILEFDTKIDCRSGHGIQERVVHDCIGGEDTSASCSSHARAPRSPSTLGGLQSSAPWLVCYRPGCHTGDRNGVYQMGHSLSKNSTYTVFCWPWYNTYGGHSRNSGVSLTMHRLESKQWGHYICVLQDLQLRLVDLCQLRPCMYVCKSRTLDKKAPRCWKPSIRPLMWRRTVQFVVTSASRLLLLNR